MATNEERGNRVYRYALLYAHEVSDNEDIETAIRDLMTDLAHLSEIDYGYTGEEAFGLALANFIGERDVDDLEEALRESL